MNALELKSAIHFAMALFEQNADELRDLDAALGDGDLGITASSGAQAVRAALDVRGRASWLQERSIGLQDPGATAFLRFLESWRMGAK
jgi:dihydroxyacetone kinase-like protein